MEFYSARDPNDPAGEYIGSFNSAEARELSHRANEAAESQAATLRQAQALARAALLK
jgi:hypothetical protein